MPQSNTGSVTQECHLSLSKNDGEFVLASESTECTLAQVEGELQLMAWLPKDKDRLIFCVTDFATYDGRYEVRASSAIDPSQALVAWESLVPGDHWSPSIDRDPQAPPEETRTITMTIVLEIYGPLIAGATTPPAQAGVVKPPTTVVLRSRLEVPGSVVA